MSNNLSGIELTAAAKNYSKEQDKFRDPAETVAWVKERFAESGRNILQNTKRIDSGRLDIPVYVSLCGREATLQTGNQKQMGKGASPDQAEASALMELAERYSFFHFVNNRKMAWHTAPEAGPQSMFFAQVAKSLYHPEDDRERAEKVYNLLPQRWWYARNLTLDCDALLPFDWFYMINEYNGPSAGNCLEEAMVQSLCELAERHTAALVSMDKLHTPTIDPDSIKDPVCRELIEKFRAAKVEMVLKDFTCELGIPSVAAICWDPETMGETSEMVYASGTATSPEKAAIRAITEVAQLAGDFENRTNYKVSALPKFDTLEEAAYVLDDSEVVSIDTLPDISADDFALEVKNIVAALKERGFTAYCINITNPELNVPAVYSIIPGAHFAERTTGTDIYFHTAKLASQLSNPHLSLAVLEEMADLAGENYHLEFFKGVALNNIGEHHEALEALNRALELDPPKADVGSIQTHIGLAWRELGDLDKAKHHLGLAASLPEAHHEVFNLLGACHYGCEEYNEAMEIFSHAIELEPGEAVNYANIGSCLRNLGNPDEAMEMYEHALTIDPGLQWVHDALEKLRSAQE